MCQRCREWVAVSPMFKALAKLGKETRETLLNCIPVNYAQVCRPQRWLLQSIVRAGLAGVAGWYSKADLARSAQQLAGLNVGKTKATLWAGHVAISADRYPLLISFFANESETAGKKKLSPRKKLLSNENSNCRSSYNATKRSPN